MRRGGGVEELHRDKRPVGNFCAEGSEAHRCRERVQRVEVVAEVQASHGERYALRRLLLIAHQRPIGRLALDAHLGILHALILVEHVSRQRQLVLLTGEECAAAIALRAERATQRACQAVHCLRTGAAALLGSDEVEHAHGTLCIVAGTGIGDDFYLLNGRGRHHLQHLRGILRKHGIGLAVDIDLKRRRAVHGDVILTIDGDHGHLAKHVEHRGRTGIGVGADVVRHFVGLHLHHWLGSGDGDAFQLQ